MKKILLVIFLIICTALAYIPLNNQIYSEIEELVKEDSIKNEQLAIHLLDSMFGESRSNIIVTTLYHNCTPKYEILPASKKTKVDKKNELFQLYKFQPEFMINWNNPLEVICGDIRVDNSQGDWYAPLNGGNYYGIWQSGWALGCAKRISLDKYCCFMIIPYMVGYLRKGEFYYAFKPTIHDALNTAFDFYTKNEKSEFVHFMGDDNMKKFMHLVDSLRDYNPRHYNFEKVENNAKDFEFANPGLLNGTNYIMFNGCFRVYIAMIYPKTYKLKYDKEIASFDKKYYIEYHEEKLKELIISIECGFGLVLILIVIHDNVKRRRSRITILDKLIKASNPRRFMKRYNQETVEIANRIYSSAKKCKIEDKEEIDRLCIEAEALLNISFVDNKEIKKLLKRCNPMLFMKPYDAEKVARANEIYGRIKKGKLSYADYVKILQDVEDLYINEPEESKSSSVSEYSSN